MLYFIEQADVDAIKGISKRLYTETRMNGDEMRDSAQRLRLIHETAEALSDVNVELLCKNILSQMPTDTLSQRIVREQAMQLLNSMGRG